MHKVTRRSQLKETVGLSYSTCNRLEAAGDFPRRIHLTEKTVGWLTSDLEAWLAQRTELSAAGRKS